MFNSKEVLENHAACAETIHQILRAERINNTVNYGIDSAGSWVSINVQNPNPAQLKIIAKIKSKFESSLEAERVDRPKSKKNRNKVDYISVNVKYTNDFKESVWAWIQSKFDGDMGNLPKKYMHLDQYHVGRKSHISAFKMINLAIFDRLKDTSFWRETV
jgi:hypothetical protein